MSVGMAHPDPPFHRVSQGCMQGAAWHWGLRWGLSWGRSHCSLHLRGHWWDSVPGRPLEWGPGFLAGWWMETLLGSLLQGSLPRRTRLHQSPWEREKGLALRWKSQSFVTRPLDVAICRGLEASYSRGGKYRRPWTPRGGQHLAGHLGGCPPELLHHTEGKNQNTFVVRFPFLKIRNI